MELKAPRNPNYSAVVVRVGETRPLSGLDNIVAAILFNSQVLVSKDTQPGTLGLYFPVETALSQEFLAQNNLFRKPEYGNADPAAKGFFDPHGRVKCIKFKGHKSEGFWIPFTCLDYIVPLQPTALPEGVTFDFIGDHEICRKYVPKGREGKPNKFQERQARLEDSIVDGQFRFHGDTENLRRNAHKIHPEQFISITDKHHGTSVVVAKILVKRQLPWYERVAKRLGFQIQESVYGLTYSSRKVIKAVNGQTKASNHYYSEDIWGVVAKEVEDKIPNGFTLYGEIVGFTPNGSAIQPGYAYGCAKNQHKFEVYRITQTNNTGLVIELSWPQVLEFCDKYGLLAVPTFAYGRAKAFYPFTGEDLNVWQQEFVHFLESEFVKDQDCPLNEKGTPAEGVVVRIDRLQEAEALKLKSFRFLERESKQLDKGELDIETEQSEAA